MLSWTHTKHDLALDLKKLKTRKIAVASNKSKELKKEKKIKTIIQLDNLRCNVKQMNKMVSKVKQHQLMPILGGCGAGP